jgi:hypothetical protein
MQSAPVTIPATTDVIIGLEGEVAGPSANLLGDPVECRAGAGSTLGTGIGDRSASA